MSTTNNQQFAELDELLAEIEEAKIWFVNNEEELTVYAYERMAEIEDRERTIALAARDFDAWIARRIVRLEAEQDSEEAQEEFESETDADEAWWDLEAGRIWWEIEAEEAWVDLEIMKTSEREEAEAKKAWEESEEGCIGALLLWGAPFGSD